ncbi:hypothetical protein GF327_10095 [Candidatus Woesearchaeota archaeon]|nr:hypothetical protein [Candidatus Woesearchaeota archaeon]
MLSEKEIRENMDTCLLGTSGKKKEIIEKKDKIIAVNTDLTYIDGSMVAVPFLGQIRTRSTIFWSEKIKNVIESAVLNSPDPNILILKKYEKIPLKFRVSGYLSGKIWEDYKAGSRVIHGLKFNKNLKKNQELGMPIVIPISENNKTVTEKDIIENNILTQEEFIDIEKTVLRVYNIAKEIASQNNILISESVFNFGKIQGKFIICENLLSPESTTFWRKDSYRELFEQHRDQISFGKEYAEKTLDKKEQSIVKTAMNFIEIFERLSEKQIKIRKDYGKAGEYIKK